MRICIGGKHFPWIAILISHTAVCAVATISNEISHSPGTDKGSKTG
ncbi:hypothetical protein SLEP1_g9032 [Rubroshorea leprosula]|uniref:Uncharacterized protein n=1 Tax=Rubroshorea leprosula TaxID=152421 RepID=A0AAV5IDH6_9ROSI|nr:hypothetical protein SLEP1_g9032 [Rubroshorea leprosula]